MNKMDANFNTDSNHDLRKSKNNKEKAKAKKYQVQYLPVCFERVFA